MLVPEIGFRLSASETGFLQVMLLRLEIEEETRFLGGKLYTNFLHYAVDLDPPKSPLRRETFSIASLKKGGWGDLLELGDTGEDDEAEYSAKDN